MTREIADRTESPAVPDLETSSADRQRRTRLLARAGQLLLEYNESSAATSEALVATAQSFTTERCYVAVSYRSIVVALGDGAPVLRTVRELRLNAAVQTQIHEVLEQVRCGECDIEFALASLAQVDATTPRHPRWLVALMLGAGAASFARLLGADAAAIVVAGVATALGVIARQELGRRHFNLLALPFTAACLGAILGGLAARCGWTRTPELVLIVPALMIVPGPHVLNGLFDLIDNHLPNSLSRLGLAMGILLASALGIVIGVRLILPSTDFPSQPARSVDLNLVSDMLLAGIATCGFAAFFNTPWRQMWTAALGGMVGHGLRFVALDFDFPLDTATFFGGLAVGSIAAAMARSSRGPVVVIAFAGAVTMIPGSSFYRALGGALQLARLDGGSEPELVESTLSYALEGLIVVCGLALGLILGIRGMRWLLENSALGAERRRQSA